jgi:HAE1 family hydrophobic/amphiphilic exporter-1
MNMSALFIKRPVTTTLLMLGILVFGGLAYQVLPVADLPSVDFPSIRVQASLPGASPETMAASVALPLEKQFTSIAGVTSINSTSTQGGTDITIQFDINKNIDAAAQDVQSMIGRASRQLPPEMPSPPSYQKVNPADQSIFFIVLRSSTLSLAVLDEIAQSQVAQRISMVSGVAQVNIFGSQKFAVRVDVDPRELAARSIGIDEVANAINNANSNLPTGTIYGERTFVVRSNGQLMRAAAYGPTIIAYRNGMPVRLDEVAHVYDGVENDKTASWQNGERCIYLPVQKQPGVNVVETVDRIKALLPTIREQLPASVTLDVRSDRALTIRESVHDVKLTLMITVMLVVLVIFLFLRNLSATIIPSLALPCSLVGTFAVMYLLGYSLDNLSLMALTLSVGFVVDDAIVMLENIVRHMEMGKNAMQAAYDGSKEVAFTILSMTLSLGGRVHPRAVHGRHRRSPVARVCDHHYRGDSDLGLRLDQPDAHAVQPIPPAAACAESRPSLQPVRVGIRYVARCLQRDASRRPEISVHHCDHLNGSDGCDRVPVYRSAEGLPAERRPGTIQRQHRRSTGHQLR